MIPSLSVVQTEPSRRRNDAPALSSPPKPTDPSTSPSTNHLKPTGTSSRRRPSDATTRSIIDDETSVLPTATSRPHAGRASPNRYATNAASRWLGFISPVPGTTTPWRSASVSLASARSNLSRRATSLAIADGEDGSIRIFPSQSRVMNANCGSTASLVTVRSRPYRSPIRPQYATDAPPSGSTPIRSPDARTTSRSTTLPRSAT